MGKRAENGGGPGVVVVVVVVVGELTGRGGKKSWTSPCDVPQL